MLTKKMENLGKTITNMISPNIPYYKYVHYNHLQAAELIRKKLLENAPVMICRFGSNELDCVSFYLENAQSRRRGGTQKEIEWDDTILYNMHHNAGMFPPTGEMLERFSVLMLEDMKLVDVLGSWMKKEKRVFPHMPHPSLIMLNDLEPYMYGSPWSVALKGKRVLVVHPFEKSIRSQYERREYLFEDKDILPEFELLTIKAVQSIAGEKPAFKDWFEALEFMKDAINTVTFDVALIGCGAYGFPLAAHVKRMGKKAVHLGGALQMLFGIRGSRWEHPQFARHFNEYWVRPLEEERPKDASSIENGCYW